VQVDGATGAVHVPQARPDKAGKPVGYDAQQQAIVSVSPARKFVIAEVSLPLAGRAARHVPPMAQTSAPFSFIDLPWRALPAA
jgi:hypothetical protein